MKQSSNDWDRLSHEPEKAYRWFECFRTANHRDIQKINLLVRDSQGTRSKDDRQNRILVSALDKWIIDYRWYDRVAAYDQSLVIKDDSETEEISYSKSLVKYKDQVLEHAEIALMTDKYLRLTLLVSSKLLYERCEVSGLDKMDVQLIRQLASVQKDLNSSSDIAIGWKEKALSVGRYMNYSDSIEIQSE